jgi:hypothetical protein
VQHEAAIRAVFLRTAFEYHLPVFLAGFYFKKSLQNNSLRREQSSASVQLATLKMYVIKLMRAGRQNESRQALLLQFGTGVRSISAGDVSANPAILTLFAISSGTRVS